MPRLTIQVVAAERLRRWTRNPLGSPRPGLNPADYGKSTFWHTWLVLFCRRLRRPFKEFMNGWDTTGTPRGLDDEDMTELGSRAIVVTTWVQEEQETHKTLQTIGNRKASSAETDNADCTGHLIQTLPISFLLLLYKFIYFGLCQLLVVTRRIFTAARRILSSCSTGTPECMGSLTFPVGCEILLSRPGIKPSSPALGGRSLTTGPPGKTLLFFFLSAKISVILKKK